MWKCAILYNKRSLLFSPPLFLKWPAGVKSLEFSSKGSMSHGEYGVRNFAVRLPLLSLWCVTNDVIEESDGQVQRVLTKAMRCLQIWFLIRRNALCSRQMAVAYTRAIISALYLGTWERVLCSVSLSLSPSFSSPTFSAAVANLRSPRRGKQARHSLLQMLWPRDWQTRGFHRWSVQLAKFMRFKTFETFFSRWCSK